MLWPCSSSSWPPGATWTGLKCFSASVILSWDSWAVFKKGILVDDRKGVWLLIIIIYYISRIAFRAYIKGHTAKLFFELLGRSSFVAPRKAEASNESDDAVTVPLESNLVQARHWDFKDLRIVKSEGQVMWSLIMRSTETAMYTHTVTYIIYIYICACSVLVCSHLQIQYK